MPRALIVLCAALLLLPLPADADRDAGEIALVEDTDGSIHAAVSMPNIYLARAMCAFRRTHPDQFDAIFVFTAVPLNMLTNVQQGWPVKQDQRGIGRGNGTNDQTAAFCSPNHRLRQAVKMGDIYIVPNNPDDIARIVPFYPLTGVELVAHEFGHHWMTAITFDKGDGKGRQCMIRGYEPSGEPQPGDEQCSGGSINGFNQHWSYYFNSCSLMYGSCIEDLGNGSFRFTYPLGVVKFGHFDQYLMGLRLPEEVEPSFVAWPGDPSGSASIPMQHTGSGEAGGERVDVTVEDIIRAEGPRVPALDQCHWKAAFILLHAAGSEPSAEAIAKVDRYRTRWEEFYAWATDGRGSFDTTLDGRGTGTEGCRGEPSIPVDGDKDTDQAQPDGDPEAVDGDLPPDGDQVVADGDADPVDEIDQSEQSELPDGDTGPADGDLPTVCAPGTVGCNGTGTAVIRCLPDGSSWEVVESCSADGKVCDAGQCVTGEDPGGNQPGGCSGTSGGVAGLLLLGGLWSVLRRRQPA